MWRPLLVTTILASALGGGTGGAVDLPPGGSFWDDDGNVHEPLIEAIAAAGITKGCSDTWDDLYCPDRAVTRGEMAAFLVRALSLEPADEDRFSDDDESIFEADIDALAASGVTMGCAPGRYCPDRLVSRGEMAAFLVRGLGYPEAPAGDPFIDDDESIYEEDAERLATAGVTKGCNPPLGDRFCPERPVRRDEMASFLARALELSGVTPPPRPARSLAFTGDTLIHLPVAWQAAAYGDETGAAYDFGPMFAAVQPIISAADVALCHLEVPLTGATRGLSGYPLFSAPPQLADALAWAGYEGCSTASNHSMDQGFSGLVETLEVLEAAGLGHSGTAATEADSQAITTYDADGVTVAHISATWWLNGLQVPEDAPWSVELVDVDRLHDRAAQARSEGADYVVASIHCCVEYQPLPTTFQVAIDQALIASPDIDLVVGHHAHVVQPVDHREGEYIVYGLGNFLSGQLWSPPTTDGVVVAAEIALRGDHWATRSVQFTPTWVERGSYRILPAAESIAAGWPSPSLTAELAASWKRTAWIVGLFEAPDVTPTAFP